MRDEGKQSGSMICCDACGTAVPAYDVVSYGSIEQGYRELCNRCFNAEVASAGERWSPLVHAGRRTGKGLNENLGTMR